MNCSLPGSSLHGILQARILDRVQGGSHAPLQGILRPRDPRFDPGLPGSPALQADPLPSEPPGRSNINSDSGMKQDLKVSHVCCKHIAL